MSRRYVWYRLLESSVSPFLPLLVDMCRNLGTCRLLGPNLIIIDKTGLVSISSSLKHPNHRDSHSPWTFSYSYSSSSSSWSWSCSSCFRAKTKTSFV